MTEPRRVPRLPVRRLPVLMAIILAVLLRCWDLDQMSVWQDEGLSLYRSGLPLRGILAGTIPLGALITRDVHPPFYFLLLAAWQRVLGLGAASTWGAKALSMLGSLPAIPLLWALARRLLRGTAGAPGRRVAGLAALLGALSPAWLWYSQEIRSYSLLVTLGLLAAYGLARAAAEAPDPRGRWLALAAIATGLMLWTHYLSFLLAASLVVGAGALVARRPGPRALWPLGVAALAALPLVPYALWRLGLGAERHQQRVPLRVMLGDVVVGFGLGKTTDQTLVFDKVLDLALAAALVAGAVWLWRRRPAAASFLGAYLLLPVLLLFGVTTVKPVYLGVQHILMASPPFYVFVAAGLAGAARGGRGRLAVAAGCGLVLAGMAVAGFRFYADPAYAKDDHRALADLVRRQALPGDRLAVTDPVLGVLYGALLPGLPVQTLPPLLPSGAPDDRPPGELLRPVMADLAASSGRLWFVDAADDLGAWLDANALHVDRRVFPARTIALDLDAWESEPNLRAHQAPERRTDVTMGPLRLLGWSALPESLPAGRTARLRMVWLTPTEGPLPVLKLALRLWGPDGHLYGQGDHEPFHGLRATADWPAAQTVYAPHELDIGAGTPPGDYRLEATLYDPATGQSWPPAGPAALGILHVGRPERPLPAAALPIPRRLSARGPDVDLIGWEPAAEPDGGWLPGGAMPLAAWVRFRRAPAGGCPRLKAELADGRGRVRAEAEAEVFGCVNRAPGDLHRLPLGLALPTEEGDYSLRLRLIGPDGRARLLWRGRPLALVPARAVWLGRIGVAAQPLVTELPGGARRVGATIGEQAELAGWAGLAEGQAVTAGEILALTLFWRGGTAPRPAWDVTVQLLPLGPDGRPAGPPAAQHDGPPAGGARPASAWREGEVVADEHRLALPEGLAPGTYLLIAALYDPARPDGPRPAVLQGGRERDAAHLARIAVRAP